MDGPSTSIVAESRTVSESHRFSWSSSGNTTGSASNDGVTTSEHPAVLDATITVAVMNPRLEIGVVLVPSPLMSFIIQLIYNNLSHHFAKYTRPAVDLSERFTSTCGIASRCINPEDPVLHALAVFEDRLQNASTFILPAALPKPVRYP